MNGVPFEWAYTALFRRLPPGSHIARERRTNFGGLPPGHLAKWLARGYGATGYHDEILHEFDTAAVEHRVHAAFAGHAVKARDAWMDQCCERAGENHTRSLIAAIHLATARRQEVNYEWQEREP